MSRTQQQVADDLGWSVSKVNRIENGDNTISKTDLSALLGLLEVRDEEAIARLLEDARVSRLRGWWDRPEYRAHLNEATRQQIQIESDASTIRSFQFVAIPGLLQTRSYAAAIIEAIADDISEETQSTRLEVRLLRQENLRKRVPRPHHVVILDEFVLQRIIGSPSIIADQLKALAEAAREPDVFIRLLPREESIYLRLGSFVIYDVKDDENAFLYRELLSTDSVNQDVKTVSLYRARFEQMWDRCLKEEATLKAIEAEYAALRASLERYG